MKTIFRIAKTELRVLFYSPIAWFLLVAFFIQCGIAYFLQLKGYAGMQEMGGEQLRYMDHLTIKIFSSQMSVFDNVMQKLYLYIPLLTMGLISRETSSGTIKLLYSSPIKVRDIVLGKYLAMLIYSVLMVAAMSVFIAAGMWQIKSLDSGIMLSAVLGLFLLLCTYAAIGLFMSSLTTYQVVAAVCTFVMIGILSFVGTMWQSIDFVRDLTYFLSIQGRTQKMLFGLISSKDVLYFLVIIFMFIGFTYFKLKSGMESRPFMVKAMRYVIVVVIGLAVGYISSRPAFTTYTDTTVHQERTLTPNAQRIIKELGDEPLEVITYNNALSRYSWLGVPEQRNRLLDNWDLYTRFKPGISFRFVQYYAEPLDNPQFPFSKMYPGKTVKEAAEQTIRGMGMKVSAFKTPEEIKKIIDLEPELNRFVMQLKYKGRSTFLRVFDDQMVWPGETEVSAAFKRLLQAKLPKILFVTGDLERDIHKVGAREYMTITNTKPFRYSLINQGFDSDTISLGSRDIPEGITALVLTDPKTALSAAAQAKLEQYIDKGGNLLIAGEPGKQTVLNPILQKLGVQMMEGVVAQPSKDLTPDIVLPQLTPLAVSLSADVAKTVKDSLKVAMPGVTGLAYSGSSFTIEPLLITDTQKSWLRKTSLVLDSAQVVYDAAAGDERKALPVMISMTRKVNGKEQRIIVAGDADFMSNSNLNRFDVETANFPFITALFSWLDYKQFPIDTHRPESEDNRVKVSLDDVDLLKIVYLWVMPGIMIAFGAILLIRRKRK
ncbi:MULTISPECIES: Gldg family protein [unclassified Chitinophaga]|uniref:Gldg family protein n=1 Tax=unclassified Chitinophaga TaxID=2619133 RepID=UPI003010492B